MKKKLLLIVSVFAFCICLAVGTGAYMEYENFEYTWSSYNYDESRLTIYGYLSDDAHIVIPSEINGEPVEAIYSEAFKNCTYLESIVIPESVKYIYGEAFRGCTNLTSITVGNNVQISGNAFYNTGYYNDKNNWQNGVLYLGNNLIEANDDLTGHYSIKEGTKHIAELAFSGCKKLSDITIPASVTHIGSEAFAYCSEFNNISIPESVTKIGDDAFCYTGYYRDSANWKNDVLYIDNWVVGAKSSIAGTLTIHEGTKYIADMAFNNCDFITNVKFPQSLLTIGARAFDSCNNLKTVTFPDNVVNIEAGAFTNCNNLTKLKIGNGVTRLNYIFSSYLKTLEIGSGIESISKGVSFSNLEKIVVDEDNKYYSSDSSGVLFNKDKTQLIAYPGYSENKEYTIPGSVKSIDCSLYNIKNLEHLIFADDYNSTDIFQIMGCKKLKTITLGASFKGQGDYGYGIYLSGNTKLQAIEVSYDNKYFSDIDGVLFSKDKTKLFKYPQGKTQKTYVMPSTVKWMNSMPFANCIYLENVTLGEKVEVVNYSAFAGCTKLKTVSIYDKLQSVGDDLFEGCTSLSTIYFKGTSEQWNKLFENRRNPQLSKVKINYNFVIPGSIPNLKIPKILVTKMGKNTVTVKVVDKKGKAVPNATVFYTDLYKTYDDVTNQNGEAKFILDGLKIAETPLVIVSKDGYKTAQTSTTSIKNKKLITLTMIPDSERDISLISAKFSQSSDMSKSVNILNKESKIPLIKDYGAEKDGYFYVQCEAKTPSKVTKYEFVQDGVVIVNDCTNGKFKLHTDDFSKGGNCVIRTWDADNTHVDTPIQLLFYEVYDKPETEFQIKPDGAISLKIEDSVPIVGGSTISFDFPLNCPVTMKTTETSVQYGFNFDVNKDPDDKEKETIKSFKELCKKSTKIAGTKLNKKGLKTLKSYMKKANKVNFISGFKDIDVSIIGYAERNLEDSVASGKVYVFIEIPVFELEQNLIVGIVPITFRVNVDVEVQTGADFQWSENNEIYNSIELDLNPSVKLHAFGGVGVSKLVGAGVYGDISVSAEMTIMGNPCGFESLIIEGSHGAEAYLGWIHYENEFVSGTLYEYHNPEFNKSQEASLYGEDIKYNAKLFDEENIKVHDLTYISDESSWLGEETDASLLEAQATTQFKSLLIGTYRNAQPTMVSDGKNLYAAFVRADENENVYIAVTKYQNGVWCEPVCVDCGAVLSESPQLVFDDQNNLYIAFNALFWDIDKTSLIEYANENKIVVGKIDTNSLEFSEITHLDTLVYDHSHKFSNIDGKPILSFISSDVYEETDVAMPQYNTIHVFDILEESTIMRESVSGTIIDYAFGKTLNGYAIVYCSDDGNTYIVEEGQERILFEGVSGKVKYVALPGKQEKTFVVNGDGVLLSSDGDSISVPGITYEYDLTSNAVYYSAATSVGGANLFVVKLNEGVYTSPIQLTAEERYFENLSAATAMGNDYIFGMHTLANFDGDEFVGEKNLVWTSVAPVSDLVIDAIYITNESFTAGEDTAVNIDVLNSGDHDVTSVDLYLDGVLYEKVQIDIPTGEIKTLTMNVVCPSAKTDYSVKVVESDNDDYNADDNTENFTLGMADLSLEIDKMIFEDNRQITAIITNCGVQAASGRLEFRYSDGSVLHSEAFDEIASGESQIITAEFMNEDFYGKYAQLTVVVVSDVEESRTYNNDKSVFLSATGARNAFEDADEVGILGYYMEDTTFMAWINITEDATHFVYLAKYNTEGKMVEFKWFPKGIGEWSISHTFKDTSAGKIKLMVCKNVFTPICNPYVLEYPNCLEYFEKDFEEDFE